MKRLSSVMQKIKILGVPFSFGQHHIGVKKAPDLLREKGLVRRLEKIAAVIDLGNVDFSLCENQKSLGLIRQEREAMLASELINRCIESENLTSSFLLNLGGDHGMALGTIQGLLKKQEDMIVIWADAHGDINTPISSPSGNFHGMPLAFLLGLAHHPMLGRWFKTQLNPHKLIYFGPRDLDQEEKRFINALGIQYYSSQEITLRGAETIIIEALKKADPLEKSSIHLSFDIDICDALDIQSTGTSVIDGPPIEEVWTLGEVLALTGRLAAMDMVELNPDFGTAEEVDYAFGFALDFIEMILDGTFKRRGTHHAPLADTIFQSYQ